MSVLESLASCSQSLAQCNNSLHASVASMAGATADYPRLMRVLANDRFYELVSTDEIREAQLEVQREVEPQIKELIELAEDGLRALQKRERSLHEQVEKRKQQQEATRTHAKTAATSKPSGKTTVETAKLKARLMALQIERENLLKEVERAQESIKS